MSKYSHNKQCQNKGDSKIEKFTPTSSISESKTISESNRTLTSSFRKSFSRQFDATEAPSSSGSGGVSPTRLKTGESRDLVASKIQGGNFVNYLPQDEAMAAGLSSEGALDPVESQRVVDLLNGELSRLLKSSPRDFWKEVASNTSLHHFLDSYLKFRSRWYDFPHRGAKGMISGVIVGEFDLSRRVFMVLYRISSHRDPGARASDSLSQNDHGVLLQEKKLLDLPKLLDICAIYGHENEDLTKLLVANAIKAQPRIHDDLTLVMSQFLGIVHTMHERCSSSLEALFASGCSADNESNRRFADFLEVMDFINDAIVSMDAFISAYQSAVVFFSSPVELSYGNEELLNTLARLHDSLLPSLQRGFRMMHVQGVDKLSTNTTLLPNVLASLKMLSIRIVSFGWKLLDLCYLSDKLLKGSSSLPASTKMFPGMVEDPVIRADILVQTFREINGYSQHAQESQNWQTFLQNLERSYRIASKLEFLQSTGWIHFEDEQLQYMLGILMDPLKPIARKPHHAAALHMEEDTAIFESKISQIKELFPDYGKGFLSACLEAYNRNPDEVIQAILEGTLHDELQSLDTSLEKIPPPRPVQSASRNDKGKGKLVGQGQQEEAPSFPPSSSTGRYIRKSKEEPPSSKILDSKDTVDLAKTAALISQYEYEDEYDDSFDDLGLGVADSGAEASEAFMSSNSRKSPGSDSEGPSSNASSSKRDSRKKPQFYVKDGKNYSYKVAGSVAVADSREASLVNRAQREIIHGLGRGGNLPLGAVGKLSEAGEDVDEGGRGGAGNFRGGRRGGRNYYRKDRAMKKHVSGLGGY